MRDRAFVILNPISGHGRAGRAWPRLSRAISELGATFDLAISERPGHPTELAREALKSGYRLLVAVGGDGTFNDVANGFFERGMSLNPEAVLLPLSFGTGCDFRRSLGLPKGLAALPHLTKGRDRPIDLGRASFLDHRGRTTERYFINYADLVLGGETVARVERLPKALGGFATFLIGSAAAVLTHRSKRLRLLVDDEEVIDGRVSLVVISNGSYFGGGMHIAPRASMEDGRFDVIILRGVGRGELLWNLPKVYRGTHLSDRRISFVRGSRVQATTEERVLVAMDGEQPGVASARFEIVPRALLIRS